MTTKDFQVGDIVRFGWNNTKNHPSIYQIIGADGTLDSYFPVDIWLKGQVVQSGIELFLINFNKKSNLDMWWFDQPNFIPRVVNIDGYPLLVHIDNEVEEPTITSIWSENICTESKDIEHIPQYLINELVDKGERGVRRTLRAWPFNKELAHLVVNDSRGTSIEWYWKDK